MYLAPAINKNQEMCKGKFSPYSHPAQQVLLAMLCETQIKR